METLSILSRFLSSKEKTLLKQKGFKLIRTSHIPGGLYEGDVYVVSIPNCLKVYKTTCNDTFFVCHKGTTVLTIKYLYYNIGGLVSFNKKHAFWR